MAAAESPDLPDFLPTAEILTEPLPSSHGEVRDGVVVGLEDLGVVENLVPERVEPVQGHPDVGGRHPVLQQTQHRQASVSKTRCAS